MATPKTQPNIAEETANPFWLTPKLNLVSKKPIAPEITAVS